MKDITQISKEELREYINKKMEENKGKPDIELTPEQEKALWDAKTKMMKRHIQQKLKDKDNR